MERQCARPVQDAGLERTYLPCFSTADKLRAFMAKLEVSVERIKRIDDGDEVLESLPRKYGDHELRIILDPWFTGEGRVRYIEVKRN